VARRAGSSPAHTRPGPPNAQPSIDLHPFVARAFATLDAAGVSWSLLRGEEELNDLAGDVDLLVRPEDLPRMRAALTHLGFVEERSWGLHPHRAFIGYDSATDAWLKLDVVTAFAFGSYGEISMPGARRALARRGRVGDLSLLGPADAVWALLLHCLLDKGSVADKHRARLRELAAAGLGPAEPGTLGAHARAISIGGGSLADLVSAAEREEWTRLETAARELGTSLQKTRARAVASRRRVARAIGWRLGLLRRGGTTVALLGPDGAGKSTLAGALKGSFPVPVRTIYMGLYKRKVKLPPGVGLLGRSGLQFGRYLIGRYHRSRGRVVIFDRYTHDALVQRHSTAGFKTRAHRWLLSHAAPRPDLLLVLDLPGETLFARKGEREPVTLETMRAGYRAVGAQPGAAVLDAGADFEGERREAIGLVWGSIASRYQKRTARKG